LTRRNLGNIVEISPSKSEDARKQVEEKLTPELLAAIGLNGLSFHWNTSSLTDE